MNSTAAPLPSAVAEKTPSASRRRLLGRLAMALVALGIVAWLTEFSWHAWHYEETDDAYIAGHLHLVSPQIDGRVTEVLVAENQSVKAGDVLARLDPLQTEIGVAKAQAGVAQTQAQQTEADAALAEARARVSQAAAQVDQTEAQLELARIDLDRNQRLLGTEKNGGAITQADFDKSRSAFDALRASVNAAQASLEAAKAGLQSAQARTKTAEAAAAAAQAELRDAQRELADTVIAAPADGRIGNKSVETGNRVKAGQTLFALAEPDPWIIANFKETQLARMHPGVAVEIAVDALPGQVLHGKIDSLAPASGAEFALLPPDNATGNFNKVVQRVPVKIVLDDDSRARFGARLRLGFSVVASVRVR
ncbi:MAG TPA: HlyD family secretion protein [Opitutaceae bacterium]|nr:HlyD family secretion protein [Opitutaceae bacterium]